MISPDLARRIAPVALATCLAACALPPASPAPWSPVDHAPADVQRACAMTERKCTRCHTLDRIQVAQISHPRQWTTTIDQMRRMPASGISAADGRAIARCLVFRGFGPPGLRELERVPRPEELDDPGELDPAPPVAARP